jgi:hypothetical protein
VTTKGFESIADAARAAEREEATVRALRDGIIHSLRMRGWSRIEAENEADDRIERRRAKRESQ